MPRELKVFGYTMMASPDEARSLGMRSHNRQVRAVVATKTRKEAMEKFGIPASAARDFMTETGNDKEIAIATAKPGKVFASALDDWDSNTSIEIVRTPHVPIKRQKRLSYEEQKAVWAKQDEERAKRRFTREELEYMIEMFDSANNPVAASIADRAKLLLGDIS